MVRTDSREQTLHAFLPPKDHPVKSNESNKYVKVKCVLQQLVCVFYKQCVTPWDDERGVTFNEGF